jgi:predicted  nucleic acid-binding Zn-ribbon protein
MTSTVRNLSGGSKGKSEDECSKNKVSVSCLDKRLTQLQEELENFQNIINNIESKINLLNARINKEQYRRKSVITSMKIENTENNENNENIKNIENQSCSKNNQLPKHYLQLLFHTMLVIYLFTRKKN